MGSYSYLPLEIIFDILAALPAKSVGLCRCVSKSWRALLTQPNFIKTHLQRIKTKSVAMIDHSILSDHRSTNTIYSALLNNNADDEDKITLSVTKLSFSPRQWRIIYTSCDGLLLAKVEFSLLVINPITTEIRQVELPDSWVSNSYGYLNYGFGYDSVSDDYKIVIISYLPINRKDTGEEMLFGVYSLKTGFWKTLENPTYRFVGHSRESVFFKGCLHWLARTTKDNKQVIVAFNLVDEKFLEIPLPDSIPYILDVYYLSYKLDVLAGCLCFDTPKMVFVMKEYGVQESWTKSSVSKQKCFPLVECVLNGEQVVMEGTYNSRKYTLRNLKQGTSKKIVFNGFGEPKYLNIFVYVGFVESLISTTHMDSFLINW